MSSFGSFLTVYEHFGALQAASKGLESFPVVSDRFGAFGTFLEHFELLWAASIPSGPSSLPGIPQKDFRCGAVEFL